MGSAPPPSASSWRTDQAVVLPVTIYNGATALAGRRGRRPAWVAGAAEAWQIPEADVAGMMSFTEDEEMYERAKELRDQVHRDGVRRGLEQSRIRERALARRFATGKFGAGTAERLTRILEDLEDADRIDEVVDAIVDCTSGAELFARVRA